jgi:hypothetical protein
MKTYPNYLKILISTAFLAILVPFLWNCADYDADGSRFWLLEPNIANQRNLLPFTYTAERYYKYGWGENDTTYQVENVKEWQAMLSEKVAAQDIHQILYNTQPEPYFGKKYAPKNTFMAALKQAKNANLLQYLNYAKGCENIFTQDDEWDKKIRANFIKNHIQDGKTLLIANAKNQQLSPRIAYLLIKLNRYDNQPKIAKALFEQYFAKKTNKNWLNAAAIYQNANLQPDSIQQNIWLAKAWDADFQNRVWLYQAFREKGLAAALKATNEPRTQAVMTLIPATRKPGPALKDLQSAYKYDPTVRDLSTLMAREVNKLENWLLSPVVYGFENHFELSFVEKPLKADSIAQLKTDIAHLHACRAFVQQVIDEKKREDLAFWYLSGAHLAYLDKDFGAAIALAEAGYKLNTAPMNQKVQLHLISVLAEIGEKGQITEATENKIPLLFKAIEQNKTALVAPDDLRKKLAALLSDIFIKRNEIAKGAFLLGKTSEYTPNYGYMQSGELFEKLLKVGKPADFDKAIQMVEKPNTDFERWFASEPHRYSTAMDWNEKDGYGPAKNAKTDWDTQKLREFKAMYYMRADQPDSALISLQNVPESYWKENAQRGDGGNYFNKNPFSVGINIDNLPLSYAKIKTIYNKKTFLENLNVLRATNDPAKQQEAFFLVGNAYYNMTYYGTDWWLMVKSDKSSGEVDYINSANFGAISPKTESKYSTFGWSTLGFIFIGFIGFSSKKRRKYGFLLLLGILIFPYACKKVNTIAAKKIAATTPFADVYYRCTLAKNWYEKVQKINPDNDLGIAATYMLGQIESHQQYYKFMETRKDWNAEYQEGENAYFSSLKGKVFKSVMSCSWMKGKVK